MKVLFDTNIILDFFLAREPHGEFALKLVSMVDHGVLEGFVAATTVTTVHYLLTKPIGDKQAQRYIHQLLAIFKVAPVNHDVLSQALALGFSDFEDAVIHEAARAAGVSCIVTRDRKGFAAAELPVLFPAQFLATVPATKQSS